MHLHYFSLRSWFQFLLTDYSHLLLGGIPLDDPRSKLLTKSFWEMYRVAHSDHWVFMEHNDQLEKCIPYYLHLDEGTSLRKSAILIFNLQSAWGLDTATEFDKVRAGGSNLDAAMMDYMLQAQRHNQRGASLKSRFLYTAIPKRWYTKKYSFVYNKVLDKIATESGKLASEGIKEMFPICLGVKGDAPALAKAGHYNRSFQSLGINLECINFQIFFQSLLPTKLGKSFIFSGQQQSFEELVWEAGERHLPRMLSRIGWCTLRRLFMDTGLETYSGTCSSMVWCWPFSLTTDSWGGVESTRVVSKRPIPHFQANSGWALGSKHYHFTLGPWILVTSWPFKPSWCFARICVWRFQSFCQKGMDWTLCCQHQELHQSIAPLAKDQSIPIWEVQRKRLHAHDPLACPAYAAGTVLARGFQTRRYQLGWQSHWELAHPILEEHSSRLQCVFDVFPHTAHAGGLVDTGFIAFPLLGVLEIFEQLQYIGTAVPHSPAEAIHAGAVLALLPPFWCWYQWKIDFAGQVCPFSESGQLRERWGLCWTNRPS